MEKAFPKTSILDAIPLLTYTWSEVSETTIKNCFKKVGIFKKLAKEAINNQDDPFKDLAGGEREETINEFGERLPDEVTEELNAAVLLDIDSELSTNGDKLSDAEILAEVRGEAIQEEEEEEEEEGDIDLVYDESSAPPSAFEVEKAIDVLQQFTPFCDKGENLLETLSKVNTYSQRAIAKRKK